jgi:hypothetical protein
LVVTGTHESSRALEEIAPAVFLTTTHYMNKELEEIRKALIAINGYDEEAQESIAALEAALNEIDHHPESSKVKDLVRETANGIAAAKENPDQSLGEKWEDLKGGVSHWEEEYPGVVLAIGKVSHALAVLGL